MKQVAPGITRPLHATGSHPTTPLLGTLPKRYKV